MDEEPETEAEAYFSALDQATPGPIQCNNCGYEMNRNFTSRHKLSGSRKCSTEMAMQIANGTASLAPEIEDYIKSSAVGASPEAPPKAFALKKPSWFQRLLEKIF